jgi:hypothetical protein
MSEPIKKDQKLAGDPKNILLSENTDHPLLELLAHLVELMKVTQNLKSGNLRG